MNHIIMNDILVFIDMSWSGVPWRQSHCGSGLATLPSVGAVP